MMRVVCSSGMRFGDKERRRKDIPKMSEKQQDFIRQCPAYGLTPDFYQALCLDAKTEVQYRLEGFSGEYCVLAGEQIDLYQDYRTVQQMLLHALNMELSEMEDKSGPLYEDIKDRKRCVESSIKYANPAMRDIFVEMNVPEYPGVIYYGSIYEFVSYKPELGYILENLECDRYAPERYTCVSFDKLRKGMLKFANELDPDKISAWLQMVENMVPACSAEDDIHEGQCFFSFA